MPKRSSDKDNLSFHLALLKLIPYRSKTTASVLHRLLKAQGFDKSLRTVQRALQKLTEEYEIECDDRSQPYGYSRLSSAQPMSSLSGSQAAFLKIAENELSDKVPRNLIRAMAPLFEEASVILRSGNQHTPEKMWMRNVRIHHAAHPYLDPAIIGQLSSLIYERKQGIVSSYTHSQQMSPLGLFDTADSIYLVGKNEQGEISIIDLRYIISITPLTLSADVQPEFNINDYISQAKLKATQFGALIPTIFSDINNREEKQMSENGVFTSSLVEVEEPKVQIIAKGEFGRSVLADLRLPKSDSLMIEYVDDGKPITPTLQKMDLVMEIGHEFNHLTIQRAEHETDMLFLIGGSPLNTKGMIQRQDNRYFVHSQSIDEYRSLISMITNMLFTPGMICIDIDDIRTCFSQGTQGVIASSYRAGEIDSGRAELATKEVIEQLMRQTINLKETKSCLINITAGMDFSLEEFSQIGDILAETLGEETMIILGTSLDMDSQGILVSAIAVM